MDDALVKLSQRWNEDFFVAYKKKNGTWTKWHKLSEWPFEFAPNYRQVLPCELVLESDLSREENRAIAEAINAGMRKKGIGFYCSFTGNKSYHNHSFWAELEDLTPEQRTKAKTELARWILC
jgi:hypothetical protein